MDDTGQEFLFLQREISESISRLWANQNSVLAALEQTNGRKGQLLIRMKQHSDGTQCERPSLFPRAVSIIRISQFIHLYFKEDQHILRQHVEMSEAAVHSQKQPGFWMMGSEKLAQLKLSGANPSEKIPLCSQTGWDAQERMLRALTEGST